MAVPPQLAEWDGEQGEGDRYRQRPEADMDFDGGPGRTAGHEPDDARQGHADRVEQGRRHAARRAWAQAADCYARGMTRMGPRCDNREYA